MPTAHDDQAWASDAGDEEARPAPERAWQPLKTLGAVILFLLFGTPVAMFAGGLAAGFAIITLRLHGQHTRYEGLGVAAIAIFGVAPGFPVTYLICLGVVAYRNRGRDDAQRSDLGTAFAAALALATVGAFVAGLCVPL